MRLYQSTTDKQYDLLETSDTIIKELGEFDDKYLSQSQYIYNVGKMPVYKNTSMKYFESGEKYFESLFEDLKQAKHFIFLEYFILGRGKLLDSLVEILKTKAKEGVDVRVIYDDVGSIKVLPRNYNRILERYGIKCVKLNRYYPVASVVYNNRDHRKIAVIDGYIAYTGGVNVSDEYVNYVQRFGHWKDNGIRLYGEAVGSFTMIFLKTYDINSGTKTKYQDFLPHVYHKEQFTSDGFVQPFADGPAPVYENYIGETVYLNMINQATKYVYITTPYLIMDHLLMNALENAAKRGVDVRIITPSIADKKIVFSVTRDSYRPLIKAAVKIYEYQPGFIHAITVICDDASCVIGTINFDYRSLVHHFECGCLIINSSIIKDIKEDFVNTMKESKIPDKKVYNHKSAIKRLWIAVLRLFSPLM